MISLLLAAALAIPPKTHEVPVSAPVLERQPLSQNGQRIASNGSMALCAWNDNSAVVASRIDANGSPLDVPGIVISDGDSVVDVFWNGDAFVVVLRSNVFVFVSTDGTIAKRVAVEPNVGVYAANTDEGASTRVLLLPAGGYSPDATLLDANLQVVKQGSNPTGVPSGAVAAWNGKRFLVVRTLYTRPDAPSLLSEAMDRDGNVVSSAATNVAKPFDVFNPVLTGDARGGFALFYGRTMYPLDDRGVSSSPAVTLQAQQPLEVSATPLVATKTADGFIASWGVNLTSGYAPAFVSRNGGAPELTYNWPGRVSSVVADAHTNLIATAFDGYTAAHDDVFVQKGSAPPQLVTMSAPLQTSVALAAGSNGFLASWVEVNESGARLMARRFSQFGEPQGEPLEVEKTTTVPDALAMRDQPLVTFADGVYLIVWVSGARRLDAVTGEWIDAGPFATGHAWVALASNGREAMAVALQSCITYDCVAAQPVAMHGDPLAAPAAQLHVTLSAAYFSLASNGTDYLMTWGDAPSLISGGYPGTQRAYALRLRSDGTAIDPKPLLLSENFVSMPVAAWNGSRYLVTWIATAGTVAGAYVSPEGAVEQAADLVLPLAGWNMVAFPVALGDEFVIVTEEQDAVDELWRATIPGGQPVEVWRQRMAFGPLAAASNGSVLMFAHDDIDPAAGHIQRVFLDPRAFLNRRRITR